MLALRRRYTYLILTLAIGLALFIFMPAQTFAGDPCQSHSHSSGVTMDCANSLSATSSTMSGAGVTETEYTNDNLYVRIFGTELCRDPRPIMKWLDYEYEDDVRVLSLSDTAGIASACFYQAVVNNRTYHDADGANHHDGVRVLTHPNNWLDGEW